jgi:hypothetical protein
MIVVQPGQSYDEAEFPGSRSVLYPVSGTIDPPEAIEPSDPVVALSAFAGMDFRGSAAGANLTATWQNITGFTELIGNKNINVNLANGSFNFAKTGTYEVTAQLTFQHTSSNAGRTGKLRPFRAGSVAVGAPFGIGRDVTVTNINTCVCFNISLADLGVDYFLQIMSPDNIAGIVWEYKSVIVKDLALDEGQ